MSKPTTIYSNMINLSGLYSRNPVVCRLSMDKKLWWDKTGDYHVSKLGLHMNLYYGFIRFSSIDKKEVELWMSGVKSVMKMLTAWSKQGMK